jgi:hypothetical protein
LSVTPSRAQGTNPTISDAGANTAGGSNALELNNTSVTGGYSNNTAFGQGALQNNICEPSPFITCGTDNTAVGVGALNLNSFTSENTAIGYQALYGGGNFCTAVGSEALKQNQGVRNTAIGYGALTTSFGSENTATGFLALTSGGNYNTAVGTRALEGNGNTGNDNSALGRSALLNNINGDDNTALGLGALRSNTHGNYNVGLGIYSLYANTTGLGNVAAGDSALQHVTSGQYNIGMGFDAGQNITAGHNNIEIGSSGSNGDESNTIRIGQQGTQTQTYISGIYGAQVSGVDVVVDSNGRLGVMTSSVRYKHDIHDIGESSNKLLKLRPVSFRYKSDPTKTLQYGLVAEEVEKVYPELVTYGPDGQAQGVRYLELTPMLVAELRKQSVREATLKKQILRQTKQIRYQSREINEQATQVEKLSEQFAQQKADFEKRLSALEQVLASMDTRRFASSWAKAATSSRSPKY